MFIDQELAAYLQNKISWIETYCKELLSDPYSNEDVRVIAKVILQELL